MRRKQGNVSLVKTASASAQKYFDATDLQFLSREATAETSLCVVAFRRCLHNWSQQADRSREHGSRLLLARLSSLQLLRRLIEPRLDTQLPLLAKVIALNRSVVFHSTDEPACPETSNT